ncbi:MAG: hypothetical protein ACOH2N_10275 [Devosia sp.]
MIAKFGSILVLTLALTAPLAAEPFHIAEGQWREYNHDWLAACPDVIDEKQDYYYYNSCFASTGGQEQNATGLPAYKLTILRNRLTGILDVAVTVAADEVRADTSRALVMEFSGAAAMRFDFATDLETRYNTVNQYYVVDPERKAALLESMKQRNAMTMTVPLTGAEGDAQTVRLSMRGVLASLDFMATFARKVAQY